MRKCFVEQAAQGEQKSMQDVHPEVHLGSLWVVLAGWQTMLDIKHIFFFRPTDPKISTLFVTGNEAKWSTKHLFQCNNPNRLIPTWKERAVTVCMLYQRLHRSIDTERYESCHGKMCLKIFVIVIPKDGLWAGPRQSFFWYDANYGI